MLASPVRAQSPEPAAITPALVDAAKKEGKVILYSSMDLPVGEKLGKAFEATYPGVSVQIERSGSERLFQRVDQEFASNIRAADIINSSDASHFITWKRNGWLMPFVPEDVAQIFSGSLSRSRRVVRDLADLAVVDRLQHQPCKGRGRAESFADLLDPKWAGKMVKGHPAYSGTIMTATFRDGARTRLGIYGEAVEAACHAGAVLDRSAEKAVARRTRGDGRRQRDTASCC